LENAKVYGCDPLIGDAAKTWSKKRDGLGADLIVADYDRDELALEEREAYHSYLHVEYS
jgi:hypothetical protein